MLVCVVLSLALCASIAKAAEEVTILIGDKDRYDLGLPPATGEDVRELDLLGAAAAPYVNVTDMIMNDNYPIEYIFSWDMSTIGTIISAHITINALDVESMGHEGDPPVTPMIDDFTMTDQYLISSPKDDWNAVDNDYATETTFDLSACLCKLRDGTFTLRFPAGNHGDNVAFDYVELQFTWEGPVGTKQATWGELKRTPDK